MNNYQNMSETSLALMQSAACNASAVRIPDNDDGAVAGPAAEGSIARAPIRPASPLACLLAPEGPVAGCHEFYAPLAADAAAASALSLGFAACAAAGRPLLWVRHSFAEREAGRLHAPGLAEFGLDPARLILVRLGKAEAVLQAGLEAARSGAPGAVIVEFWGPARAYDLTASRRLALAARAAGRALLIVRIAAAPEPSAADSRWQVAAAPSRALLANAPGSPRFALTLLRHRQGFAGGAWLVEWNRDEQCFTSSSLAGSADAASGESPPLSGRVLPLPAQRPAAADARAPAIRRAG